MQKLKHIAKPMIYNEEDICKILFFSMQKIPSIERDNMAIKVPRNGMILAVPKLQQKMTMNNCIKLLSYMLMPCLFIA